MSSIPVFVAARELNLPALTLLVALAFISTSPLAAQAQPGTVLSHQKISDTEGNFTGGLDPNDRFSIHMADIGDFDGDGVRDFAVGAPHDGDGGVDRGAVWLLFLNSDGTVKEHRKISSTEGNFTGPLDDGDRFCRVASLGDLDGDGVTDLAVGAHTDDDGGLDRGAVWILFLNSDGTVKKHQKISDTEGGFGGVLDDGDAFGWHVTTLRDFDDDGNPELAVGAIRDDDGVADAGAVWILFLNSDGTVRGHQKISATEGGFSGDLDPDDDFGHAVAPLGDLDGDGVWDLAVGAFFDDDGGENAGAVWILFLNSDGTVKGHQKISASEGGFTGILDSGDLFSRVWELPDIDGDHVKDLAVGAVGDDDGIAAGAVWILFLNSDGTVKGHQKISPTEGGFTGGLDNADHFGWSGAFIGDPNGDGRADMAVGALWDDDGGIDCGAVWILFLDGAVMTAVPEGMPSRFTLYPNVPNPFNPSTMIRFDLPQAGEVELTIYDMAGRRMRTLVQETRAAGSHEVFWHGTDDRGLQVATGVYLYRLRVGSYEEKKWMTLLK